jgi:hypothetical protein
VARLVAIVNLVFLSVRWVFSRATRRKLGDVGSSHLSRSILFPERMGSLLV